MGLKDLPASSMTPEEIKEARLRVAMKDFNHLQKWIQASDREFLIFYSKDLLDSIAFAPENAQLVQQIVQCYQQHRMAIAYDVREMLEPTTGETIEEKIFKDDRLTVAEKDRLIRKLAADLSDAVPGWSLEGEPIG